MDLDVEAGEIAGTVYLFLKEQFSVSAMPSPSGIPHGKYATLLLASLSFQTLSIHDLSVFFFTLS